MNILHQGKGIKVAHGSVVEGSIPFVMGDDKADVIWCDPPWGQGLMGFFDTLNQKQTGSKKRGENWSEFLTTLARDFFTVAKGPVIINIGKKWVNEVKLVFCSYGFTYCDIVTEVYRGYECKTLLFWKGVPVEGANIQSNAGLEGQAGTTNSVSLFKVPNGILLDPCCGKGYAIRSASANGMQFRGGDINEHRIKIGLKKWQEN